MLPPSKPRLSYSDVAARVDAAGLNRQEHPFFIVGIRGYYRDTMGAAGVNDRGIYDDAIFLVSPLSFSSYNANTDPSGRRPGRGFGREKGMARLQPGVWPVYRLAKHNPPGGQPYEAICQRGGEVEVMRDGNPDYPHRGSNFGINIHRGGYTKTSSAGCQTIHPDQWPAFIAQATDLAKRHHGTRWRTTNIPYVLLVDSQ
jgi:lysozyme